MSRSVSKCHGTMVYFRQINGKGKALPHCSTCHKLAEVEEEENRASPNSKRGPLFGIRRDGYGGGGHRHG